MTQRLYLEDAYATEFKAKVVQVTPRGYGGTPRGDKATPAGDGVTPRGDEATPAAEAGPGTAEASSTTCRHAIILDATLFYPESGGQPGDTGTIGGLKIEATVEDGDTILHLTSDLHLASEPHRTSGKPLPREGDEVSASIDWPRRFINMQQHTGQHILSQAFLQAIDAPTVSSRLGTEHSTVDVGRLDLTWGDMEKAERLSNSIVFENRPVRVYLARADGVSDLRLKKPIARDDIRVVEVEGFDKSPCGGTHTRTTGEVGPIKILRWEKVRDTTRVEFICGALAEADYFWKNRFVVELAQELTTRDTSVPGLVKDLYSEHKQLRRECEHLRRELIGYRIGDLENSARHVEGVRVVTSNLERESAGEIREMAAQLTGKPKTVALLAAGAGRVHFIFARSADVDVDMRPLIKAACEIVDGKGGGKPAVCQGGGKNAARVAEAIEAARGLLERMLGGPA